MSESTRYVGLDVHAETIAVAVAEASGTVRSLGTIANRPEAVRKLFGKLGACSMQVCYEAGPSGFALYRQLRAMDVNVVVIAPTLIPKRPGERVKTDRLDAEKLARCLRAGELTAVTVPSASQEAVRDLVRARLAAKADQLRARHRVGKFLLRHGLRGPEGTKRWSTRFMSWVRSLRLEHAASALTLADYVAEVDHLAERIQRLEHAIAASITELSVTQQQMVAALQALRGVAFLTAITLVVELGSMLRFAHPKHLMGYSGLVPREHSSGGSVRRGAITKTGNAHIRRVLVEAAWSYRAKPSVRGALAKRQVGLAPQTCQIALRAQHRLHGRYVKLLARGKPKTHVVTSVARELLGFIWSIGVEVEQRTT